MTGHETSLLEVNKKNHLLALNHFGGLDFSLLVICKDSEDLEKPVCANKDS